MLSIIPKVYSPKTLHFWTKGYILTYVSVMAHYNLGFNFAVLSGEVAVPCTRNPL